MVYIVKALVLIIYIYNLGLAWTYYLLQRR